MWALLASLDAARGGVVMTNSGRASGRPTAYSLQARPQTSAPVLGANASTTGARCRAMVFATVNVSIAATGTGFLSFPFAFSQAGLLGGAVLVCAAPRQRLCLRCIGC